MSTRRVLAVLIGIEEYPYLDSSLKLRGPLADVEAMACLLRSRCANLGLHCLLDQAATRDGVLAALNRLEAEAQGNDEVLVYWAGHGSQVRSTSDEGEVDGWNETLVPSDSGRGDHPNRDIVDDEIHAWLTRLTAKTKTVSLIVDACHSGTVARTGVRNIPRDPRPHPFSGRGKPRQGVASLGPAGWLPVSSDWVLLAACRDDQMAIELLLGERVRGVFTWALEAAIHSIEEPNPSWADLFRIAEARVSVATYGVQVPQIEGNQRRVSILG